MFVMTADGAAVNLNLAVELRPARAGAGRWVVVVRMIDGSTQVLQGDHPSVGSATLRIQDIAAGNNDEKD
jgi:hypothetical protein